MTKRDDILSISTVVTLASYLKNYWHLAETIEGYPQEFLEKYGSPFHAYQEGIISLGTLTELIAVAAYEIGWRNYPEVRGPEVMEQREEIATLRAELVDEKQKVANLDEYMLKGVAFRDELQAEIARLQAVVERAKDADAIAFFIREHTDMDDEQDINDAAHWIGRYIRGDAEAIALLRERAKGGKG